MHNAGIFKMKTKITVKTEMEVLLPSLPNFVRTPHKDVAIPIEDLTEAQLRELGKQWTEALVDKFRLKLAAKTQAINESLSKLSKI